jgi:large subunit ribosomal protein L21
MKIAVIKTGGKQYLVKAGDTIKIEKLEAEAGKDFVFDKILLTAEDDGKEVQIGNPEVAGAKAEAKILEQGRAKKIRVTHYKSKVRYHKVYGHRQPFTKVKIEKI